ncbi:MAG: hypothetical protein KBT48_09735 [Firmicutes bacterium]|nr:hypothetical protein [Bacillota bacterium]
MKAYIPSVLYLLSAALFIGTVITTNIMYMLAGAILMFVASILTKVLNRK